LKPAQAGLVVGAAGAVTVDAAGAAAAKTAAGFKHKWRLFFLSHAATKTNVWHFFFFAAQLQFAFTQFRITIKTNVHCFFTHFYWAMLYALVDKRITNNKKIHGNKYYTQFFRQGQFLSGLHCDSNAAAVDAAANRPPPAQRLAFLRAPWTLLKWIFMPRSFFNILLQKRHWMAVESGLSVISGSGDGGGASHSLSSSLALTSPNTPALRTKHVEVEKQSFPIAADSRIIWSGGIPMRSIMAIPFLLEQDITRDMFAGERIKTKWYLGALVNGI
jgi:hypothetical protein